MSATALPRLNWRYAGPTISARHADHLIVLRGDVTGYDWHITRDGRQIASGTKTGDNGRERAMSAARKALAQLLGATAATKPRIAPLTWTPAVGHDRTSVARTVICGQPYHVTLTSVDGGTRHPWTIRPVDGTVGDPVASGEAHGATGRERAVTAIRQALTALAGPHNGSDGNAS